SEIRAGSWLGIALRPVILARSDAWKVGFLLLRRAEPHDHRTDELRARVVVGSGARPRALDLEDVALHRRPTGAAILDRPTRYRPALAGKGAVKMYAHVRVDDETGREIVGAAHGGRDLFVEKASNLVAKRRVVGRQLEVHEFPPAQSDAVSSPSAAT